MAVTGSASFLVRRCSVARCGGQSSILRQLADYVPDRPAFVQFVGRGSAATYDLLSPELSGFGLVAAVLLGAMAAVGKMIAVTRSLAHEGHMHSNDVSSLDGKAVVPVSAGWLIRRAALWMLLVSLGVAGACLLYVAASKAEAVSLSRSAHAANHTPTPASASSTGSGQH